MNKLFMRYHFRSLTFVYGHFIWQLCAKRKKNKSIQYNIIYHFMQLIQIEELKYHEFRSRSQILIYNIYSIFT